MKRSSRTDPIISTGTMALLLAACGGGGGGGGGSSSPNGPRRRSRTVSLGGRVLDGPISGARVYLDINRNGIVDDGDRLLGTTDADGLFANDDVPASERDSPLLADLSDARDTDNPTQPLSGIWRAPADAAVISPLTEIMVRDALEPQELAFLVGLPLGRCQPSGPSGQFAAKHSLCRAGVGGRPFFPAI